MIRDIYLNLPTHKRFDRVALQPSRLDGMTDQNRTAYFHCIRQTGISTLSVEILLSALLSFHEYSVEGYGLCSKPISTNVDIYYFPSYNSPVLHITTGR